MLTVEYNKGRNAVEVHGDREGLALLAKRIMALLNKDPGSYVAQGQGQEPKSNKDNILADYYLIFLREPSKEDEPHEPDH